MVAGRLVVQHHIIRARHTHEVVATGCRQQQQQVLGRILVGIRMVGVTDIHTHGQAEQLTHKMILKARPRDLPLVGQILRPNETNNRIDQKRIEQPRHAVRSGFAGQLVHAMVRFGRQGAALPCLEIHHLVFGQKAAALLMVLPHPLPPFGKQGQINAKRPVRTLCPRHRLKQQIDRRTLVQCRQLRGDMRQAASLRRNAGGAYQLVQRAQNRTHRVHRFACRVHTNHRITRTKNQPLHRG